MNAGSPTVLRSIEERIGWITFDNPARRNAMSLAMWELLPIALAELEADPAVRVIALRGSGEASFVSGADISEFERERNTVDANLHYESVAGQALASLSALGKPTVAMLSGYCLGGGVAIALGCDLRIAGDNLRYGIPAAKLGVGYGWRGVRKLVDTVGSAHARELFLTGRQFDAGHALRTGFAHRVVAAAELDVALREECRLLAGNAPLTIRSIKQIMNELARGEHDMDVARCEAATREVFASEDFLEGRSAFMQRRAPRFEGK